MSCNDTSDKDVIEFWHFQSEPNQKKALDSLLKKFYTETGISVKTTELSWADGKTKLIAGFNSNSGPDVLEIGSDWIAQFAAEDIFLRITDSIIDSGSFLDFTIEASTLQGSIYAVPWYIDSRPIMINRDLLSEFKLKWDSTITWNKIANHDIGRIDNKYLVGVNGPDRHRLYKKILPMLWSNGADIFDGRKYSINSQEVKESLEIYGRLANIGMIETQKNLDIEFLKGNIAILNSGSWLLERMQATNYDMDVVLYPPVDSNTKNGIAFAGGEYLAISTQSQSSKAAIRLVQFLSKGENALLFSQLLPQAGFPADTSYFKDQSLISGNWKQVFAHQLQFSRMTPSDNKWLDVEEVLEDEIEQVLYKEKTASEALESAHNKINEIKKK